MTETNKQGEKITGKGIIDYLHKPKFKTFDEERQYNKQKLAGVFRLFGQMGFSEGVAGHVTYRDPEFTDYLWVNPYGVPFGKIKASDFVLVSPKGEIVEGKYTIHRSAFSIHAAVHEARPDVISSVHTHSVHGKTWSASGKLLDPLTQDACAFYDDHSIFDEYKGVAYAEEEGVRIGEALGDNKAVILRSHGLLTVGESIDSAAFWFITMERTCQAQLMAAAAGIVHPIAPKDAANTADQVGREIDGWEGFQPMWERIVNQEPDFLK